MKQAYLCGPMRGYESFNFPAFDSAAEYLRSVGWGVFNPAEKDREDGFNPETDEAKPMAYYMAVDLVEVCKADALICLPGWERSEGCSIEVFVALSVGKPVLDYPSLEHIAPYVPYEAFKTCKETMDEGSRKHAPNSWLVEAPDNHAHKCARHALTHIMQERGEAKQDGEVHARMALCRAAMLMAQYKHFKMQDDAICGV